MNTDEDGKEDGAQECGLLVVVAHVWFCWRKRCQNDVTRVKIKIAGNFVGNKEQVFNFLKKVMSKILDLKGRVFNILTIFGNAHDTVFNIFNSNSVSILFG